MSTDWEKYSTPEEARQRAAEPAWNGIVALIAGVVRSIEDLVVLHSPDWERSPPNRAHTDVMGMEAETGTMPASVRKTMIRQKLFAHYSDWLLQPSGWTASS